ncbi:class F sortase [Pseudonocardia sp. MH-G8]|uniref:class F sortase n=1 Tax=Pseudonocardia sp. MH-G8 TaxID=1854588 RepID=UPI001E4767CF|nr:class F sortase [Pseudonocardia sp. MH-G8]
MSARAGGAATRSTSPGPGAVRGSAGPVTALLVVLLVAVGVTAAGRPAHPLLPLPAHAARELDGQVAPPVRIRIPAIGVDAPVGPLDVDAHGVLPAPASDGTTGWWRAGPEPGEQGAAVLAGHVDSQSGPAVFFHLRHLHSNAAIFVDRSDGSTAQFTVRRIERHRKDAFPTHSVYGPTPRSELRIITCGGAFDRAERRYRDNVIVVADRVR